MSLKPAACLAFLALSGCNGCKHTQPVAGFQSDAAPIVATPTEDVTDASVDVPQFEVVVARPVTGRALTVNGATIDPPAESAFGVWLPIDLDGDGTSTDVAATVFGSDHTARPLALFRREASGFTAVQLADVLPTDARCAEASMRLTSARSLVVSWQCDASASDGGAPPSHTMEEALVLVGPTPRLRERAGMRAPALGEGALTLSLQGIDRDGDGVDEVVINVSTGAVGTRPRSSVRAVFFDRSGGLARDTSEPAGSFGALIDRARRAISARRRGSTATVLATLDDVSRLRRAVCASSPSARLDLHGAAMPCESVAFTTASEVMVKALIAGGELPAAWALTRPATASEFGVVTNPRVLSELRRASTPERGSSARHGPPLGHAPPEGRLGARLSVLSFDPPLGPNALNVRGVAAGRVDLASLTFLGGEGGAISELLARSPDGVTAIAGFAETCSGVAAVRCDTNVPACAELAQRPSGGAVEDGLARITLGGPVSASLSRRCLTDPRASAWLGPTPRASVLSWGPTGAALAFNGRLTTVAGETATVGAEVLGAALATPEGVWLRDRTGWKLLAPPELAGRYGDLTDLTVSSDNRMIAGMIDQEVWLIERSRPAGH